MIGEQDGAEHGMHGRTWYAMFKLLNSMTFLGFPGLSLRGGDRGFPPATINVFPGYFHRKIEEKYNQMKSQLSDLPPTCCIYPATWNLSDNPVFHSPTMNVKNVISVMSLDVLEIITWDKCTYSPPLYKFAWRRFSSDCDVRLAIGLPDLMVSS